MDFTITSWERVSSWLLHHFLAMFEMTIEFATIRPGEDTLSVHLIVFPLSSIGFSVWICKGSLSIHGTQLELTFIFSSVWPLYGTHTFHEIIFPVAYENCARGPFDVAAWSILKSLRPMSLEHGTI